MIAPRSLFRCGFAIESIAQLLMIETVGWSPALPVAVPKGSASSLGKMIAVFENECRDRIDIIEIEQR
jgi:hypothetical protein